MPAQGESLARLGRLSIRVAHMMLTDLRADQFARLPLESEPHPEPASSHERVPCNHPAFVFGHLSLYPARTMEVLGVDHGAAVPDSYESLFAPGVACRDDPDGAIYPDMDAIVKQFDAAHQTLLDTLPTVEDDAFAAENPNQRMRDRLGLTTVGDACAFLLAGHMQFHLGQLSTWRRTMGLGSAM